VRLFAGVLSLVRYVQVGSFTHDGFVNKSKRKISAQLRF